MTNRLLISGSRVAITRPGFNVLDNSLPRTQDFFSLDSDWDSVERIIQIGKLTNKIVPFNDIGFPEQPDTPIVMLYTVIGDTSFDDSYQYAVGVSGQVERTNPFTIRVNRSSFDVLNTAFHFLNVQYTQHAHDFIYAILRP